MEERGKLKFDTHREPHSLARAIAGRPIEPGKLPAKQAAALLPFAQLMVTRSGVEKGPSLKKSSAQRRLARMERDAKFRDELLGLRAIGMASGA